jgi:Ran-binding protein 9/10
VIGLGICSGYTSLNALPGWELSSWGYHGDDGKLYAQSSKGITYSDTFGTGDVVGCLIAFDKGITFTKNGTPLGNESKNS